MWSQFVPIPVWSWTSEFNMLLFVEGLEKVERVRMVLVPIDTTPGLRI